MRTDSVFSMPFTFDYYEPVVNGSNVELKFIATRRGSYSSGTNIGTYLYADDAMMIGGVIRNLKDAKGTLITVNSGTPYDLFVHSSDAKLNNYAEVVGYRHNLRRDAPRDFQAQLLAIAQAAANG